MQKKTIKKNIENKINEWLDSIEDKDLANKIKPDILVSGGSIASMFLNQPVNDYDIYLKTMDSARAISEYYTKGTGIEIMDGREKDKIVSQLENDYEGVYKNIDEIPARRAVAIRTLKPDQIKLFTKDYGGDKMDYNEEDEKPYRPVFFSPNAISLSDKIQIIVRFHGDNEAIHKTFDYIHATNYWTFEDGLVTNIAALESLMTKQLYYQGSLYPLTSIIRMKKFIKRGWNIGAGEMLKIMFQISLLDLTDPDVMEEQLMGVDVAYFGKLVEVLRGVDDKTKITSSYLNTIIDQVFNEYEEED